MKNQIDLFELLLSLERRIVKLESANARRIKMDVLRIKRGSVIIKPDKE